MPGSPRPSAIVIEEFTPPLVPMSTVALIVQRYGRSRYLLERPYASAPPDAHLFSVVEGLISAPDARIAVAFTSGDPIGLCVFRRHPWDTDFFGYPVGRVDALYAADRRTASRLVEWTEALARELELAVTSTRVEGTDLPVINALERAGYEYRETTLVPWRDMSDWACSAEDGTREARPEDEIPLRDMARRMFRTGRFHRDPRFDPAKADQLYARWVALWFESPSPNRFMRVLEVNGSQAGFVQYELDASPLLSAGPVGVLVLGGVDPDCGARGMGSVLWRGVLDDLASRARWASATMVASNSPILNLYSRLGFRFSSTEVTLHRWYSR